MKQQQDIEWRALQMCKFCGGGETEDNSDNLMVLCDCCMAVGTHLKCLHQATGEKIEPEDVVLPSFQWFCGEECHDVDKYFVEVTGQRIPIGTSGVYSAEMVHYSENYRTSQNIIGNAVTIFHSAFGPSKYSDGSDLIELVCQGKNHTIESSDDDDEDEDDEPPDCTNFRVFVLRKASTIVSVAAVRAHGPLLAEVPFIATREGYRREGHCRRLLDALEGVLWKAGVKYIALPAVHATVKIWMKNFGFKRAGKDVIDALEDRIILPEDTEILIKPTTDPSLKDNAGKKISQQSLNQGKKRVRWSLPITTTTTDINSDEDDVDNESDSDDGDDDHYGCSSCGAVSSSNWHEDEDTGDFLCTSCMKKKRKRSDTQSTINNNNDDAYTDNEDITMIQQQSDSKVCYHCGDSAAQKYTTHEETGACECTACNRYRKTHDGVLRPSRLFKRKIRQQQKQQQQHQCDHGHGHEMHAVNGHTTTTATTNDNNNALLQLARRSRNPTTKPKIKGPSRKHRIMMKKSASAIIARKACAIQHHDYAHSSVHHALHSYYSETAITHAIVQISLDLSNSIKKDSIHGNGCECECVRDDDDDGGGIIANKNVEVNDVTKTMNTTKGDDDGDDDVIIDNENVKVNDVTKTMNTTNTNDNNNDNDNHNDIVVIITDDKATVEENNDNNNNNEDNDDAQHINDNIDDDDSDAVTGNDNGDINHHGAYATSLFEIFRSVTVPCHDSTDDNGSGIVHEKMDQSQEESILIEE